MPDQDFPPEPDDYIEGIYNYCDRWCERCAFTARCMNYAMTPPELQERKGDAVDYEAIWEHVTSLFQEASDMLHEMADEQGIDLDDFTEDEDFLVELEDKRQNALNHPFVVSAERYSDKVHNWFEETEGTVFQYGDSGIHILPDFSHLDEDPREIANYLVNASEIVRWYMFQIGVKLIRALRSKDEDRSWDEFDEFPKDSDGSAKVSLLGMDRSIVGWKIMHRYLPDHRKTASRMIIHLTHLRQGVEKEFPEARAFIRPGFDQ